MLMIEYCRQDLVDRVSELMFGMCESDMVDACCTNRFKEHLQLCIRTNSWKCALFFIRLGTDCLDMISDDRCVAMDIIDHAPQPVFEEMIFHSFLHSRGRGALLLAMCACRGVPANTRILECADDGSMEFAISVDSWDLLLHRISPRTAHRARMLCRCAHATACLDAMADYKYVSCPRRPDHRVCGAGGYSVFELCMSHRVDLFVAENAHVSLFEQSAETFDSLLSLAMVSRESKCVRYLFQTLQSGGVVPVLRYHWAFVEAWMCSSESDAIALAASHSAASLKVCNIRGESAFSVFLRRGWFDACAAVLSRENSPNGLVSRGADWIQSSLYHVSRVSLCLARRILYQIYHCRTRFVFDGELQVCMQMLIRDRAFWIARDLVRAALSIYSRTARASLLTRFEYMLAKDMCNESVATMCSIVLAPHMSTMEQICLSPSICDARTLEAVELFFSAARKDHDRDKVIEWCARAAKPDTCMYLHRRVRPIGFSNLCDALCAPATGAALVSRLLAAGAIPLPLALRPILDRSSCISPEQIFNSRTMRCCSDSYFAHLISTRLTDEDAASVVRSMHSRYVRPLWLTRTIDGLAAIRYLFDSQKYSCIGAICDVDPEMMRDVCANKIPIAAHPVPCSRMIATTVSDVRLLARLFGLGLEPDVFAAAAHVRFSYLHASYHYFGPSCLRKTDADGNNVAHCVARADPQCRNAPDCVCILQLLDADAIVSRNRAGMTPIDLARACGFHAFEIECARRMDPKNEFDDILQD
jgi:hypothetical protein